MVLFTTSTHIFIPTRNLFDCNLCYFSLSKDILRLRKRKRIYSISYSYFAHPWFGLEIKSIFVHDFYSSFLGVHVLRCAWKHKEIIWGETSQTTKPIKMSFCKPFYNELRSDSFLKSLTYDYFGRDIVQIFMISTVFFA